MSCVSFLMHHEADQESSVQANVHWTQEVKTDSPSTPSPWIKIKLKIKIKEIYSSMENPIQWWSQAQCLPVWQTWLLIGSAALIWRQCACRFDLADDGWASSSMAESGFKWFLIGWKWLSNLWMLEIVNFSVFKEVSADLTEAKKFLENQDVNGVISY